MKIAINKHFIMYMISDYYTIVSLKKENIILNI